jgi:hypothetical protein
MRCDGWTVNGSHNGYGKSQEEKGGKGRGMMEGYESKRLGIILTAHFGGMNREVAGGLARHGVNIAGRSVTSLRYSSTASCIASGVVLVADIGEMKTGC